MTDKQVRKAIVEHFKKMYGFAPYMKDIIFLEASLKGDAYEWVGFRVGNIGYEFSAYDTTTEVHKCTVYDK